MVKLLKYMMENYSLLDNWPFETETFFFYYHLSSIGLPGSTESTILKIFIPIVRKPPIFLFLIF